MQISGSYIDDITGSMIAIIKRLYTKRLKEDKSFSFEDRKELLRDFSERVYDLEPRLADEIGYALCTKGKFNATFNEMPKKDDTNNIFVNLDCVLVAYLGQGLEEIMPKRTKIYIQGDAHTAEIRVACGNKSYNTVIVDLPHNENEPPKNNGMER